MSHLDKIDLSAKAIGAVNTIVNRDGKLWGYNTDTLGIEYAFRNIILYNKNVLLIGAGGAGLAVAYVVTKQGGKCSYVDHTLSKMQLLQKKFGGKVIPIENLKKLLAKDIDIIINASPVGMYSDKKNSTRNSIDNSPVPAELINQHQIVFDLVYNPIETELIKLAKKKGAQIITGLDMFVAQGLYQVQIWIGKKKLIISEKLINKIKVELKKKLK